jgi:hypothetical protein
MKLIIQNNRIAGTATDDYNGPDAFIYAPEVFDESRIADYEVQDGVLLPLAALPLADVSPRQIRQALTAAGLRDQVESAVAASSADIKDWWEFSTSVERDNEHVIAMAAKLGVTERQLDDLFTLAGTL